MTNNPPPVGLPAYTNSALKTARECPQKYSNQYLLQLERIGDEREVLAVGSCWHKGLEMLGKHDARTAHQTIYDTAPNATWAEKLQRLLLGYIWYYQDQPLNFIETEYTFEVELAGEQFTGQIDGIVEIGGRRGLIEYKTTSESLEPDSSYWNRLGMDTQVGLYSLALDFTPEFILYDVTRKPTINPKKLPKKDADRMDTEMRLEGKGTYYGEAFNPGTVADAIAEGRETIGMYGARLNQDIADRPLHYFNRREVARTQRDYDVLVSNLVKQIHALRMMEKEGMLFRNPEACGNWSGCEFAPLCENNITPQAGEPAPDGYRIREHLHPELH